MKIILCIAALFLALTSMGQNVGIGTTTPTGRLQINHSTNATRVGLRLVDSAAFTAGSVEFRNLASSKRMLVSGYSESNFNNGQYLDIQSDSMYVASFRGNGMLGIRNSIPAYPLDVTGDINTTGALRVSGNAGSNGQILRSNGNGTMAWTDVSEYKNYIVFDYTTMGAIQNWIVPADVTRVKVEAWGGGGYGTNIFVGSTGETYGAGGGGGGYVNGYITVIPGESFSIIVGNGGSVGVQGGQSRIHATTSGGLMAANGGTNGSYNASLTRFEPGLGGNFGFNRTTIFGLDGQAGASTHTIFEQRSATEFVRKLLYGNGGNAGNTTNTGGIGGILMTLVSSGNQLVRTTGSEGVRPGGGGASVGSSGSGGNGAPGVVILYY